MQRLVEVGTDESQRNHGEVRVADDVCVGIATNVESHWARDHLRNDAGRRPSHLHHVV